MRQQEGVNWFHLWKAKSYLAPLLFSSKSISMNVYFSCSSSVSSEPEPGANATKQHRLASSFELGDEQPQGDAVQWKRKEDDSFHNLFGPPSLVETQKPVEDAEGVQKIEKSMVKKPLPGKNFNHIYRYVLVYNYILPSEPFDRRCGWNASKERKS